MGPPIFKGITDRQKYLILALHKSELTSRQISEVAQCAQSTVIRQLQKFQKSGHLPMTERRKATRYPAKTLTKLFHEDSQQILTVKYPNGDTSRYGMAYGIRGVFHNENPIHEQVNHYQNQFDNFSISNMMEVKHSPVTQMEFRSTNGLPDEEDEDLGTLFDDGDGKSLTPPSDDGDTEAPILNGIDKHPEVLTPTEILDSMDIDLVKVEANESKKPVNAENTDAKKENEEAEATAVDKADLEMFDVDLEEESASNPENEKITDASKVRDTGDDLDTLLSKINDLVEDCMEPNADGGIEAKRVMSDEIVEIPDDDSIDMPETSPSTEKTSEMKPNEEVNGEIEPAASTSEVTEEAATELTEEAAPDKMDIDDDDVVCLDSPLPEEPKKNYGNDIIERALREIYTSSDMEDEEETEKEEPPQADNEKEPMKKEEVIADETASKTVSEASAPVDEIFLIDDDDDDEPMKEAETPAKEKEESVKSPENVEKSNEIQLDMDKELDAEIEKELQEMIKPVEEIREEQTAKVSSDKVPANNEEVDDDEIVCLDDSIEEIDEKSDEAKECASEKAEDEKEVCEDEVVKEKEVEKAVEKEEEEEKLPEKISEEMGVTVTEKVDKDCMENESLDKESMDKESLDKVGLDKEPEKEVAEKVVEQVTDEVVEKVVEEVVEKVPEAVLVEVSKKVDVPDEAKSEVKESPIEDKKALSEPEKSSKTIDIVILDDDDDEDEGTSPTTTNKTDEKSSTADSDKKSLTPSPAEEDKKIEEKSSSSESSTAKPSTILSDNSDNARDGAEEKEETSEAKAAEEKTPIPSESNSDSSNLLKETQKEREENSEQPPAKRIRLSQDEVSSRHSTVSQENTKSKSNTVDNDVEMKLVKVVDKDNEDSKSLKRVHSTESISSDLKKPKTEESDSTKVVEAIKPEPVKPQVEAKPLPLYPPPTLDAPTIDLSLDFLRRFKKSVNKMNKSDLEELVLQKIVEAIVHKSEFSEMRDLIEKQEKIIVGHRSKITELNKQFRDLEMVHNRVLKDLETKNSQFIMPVKITRAVGLQVFFPNKKGDQPLQPPSPMQSSPAPIARNMTTLGSTPDRSSSHTNSPATSTSTAVKTPTAPSSTPTATVINNAQQTAAVQRRGCVQKLTPMRPDTPRNSPLNRSVTQGAATSSTPSPVAAKEMGSAAKTFNRTLPQNTARLNTPTANVVAASTPSPVAVQAVEKPKTITQGTFQTKKTHPSMNIKRMVRHPKPCQSDPQSVSHPLPAASTVIQPHIPPNSTTVNNAVVAPKPVTKSVIDLTDEDDVVAVTSTTNNPRAPAAAPAAVATPVARVAPSPSPTTPANRPYKVSVIPQQQLQAPKPSPPKQIAPRPLVPIAPKPNGVAVAVRQIPANPSRYRHPAPLPNQPIHSSNPAWKLPPARPTIRISNLESGIVISWTIEDTAKEKYADSTSYQIYAYQETSGPPLVESWRHVGDVKAMLLPMAVTLTQFQEGQRYYFAVRAVDAHNRCGPFSFAKTWS